MTGGLYLYLALPLGTKTEVDEVDVVRLAPYPSHEVVRLDVLQQAVTILSLKTHTMSPGLGRSHGS